MSEETKETSWHVKKPSRADHDFAPRRYWFQCQVRDMLGMLLTRVAKKNDCKMVFYSSGNIFTEDEWGMLYALIGKALDHAYYQGQSDILSVFQDLHFQANLEISAGEDSSPEKVLELLKEFSERIKAEDEGEMAQNDGERA